MPTRAAAAAAVLLGISAAAARQETPDPCPRPLAARPGGPLIGCLEEGAEVSVRERSEGWTRIWLEAWVPEGAAASAASLSVLIAGPDSVPVGGARVRLLEQSKEIEEGLASLRRRHAASRTDLQRRQAEVERELEGVLFSSDNLTQATENRRRLRAEKDALERERQALGAASRAEAMALMERHQARAGSSDAAGRIVLERLTPGSYLLLVSAGAAGQAASWWVPVALTGGERRHLEVSASDLHENPFADLD